jgi:hypothetical protein
MKTVGSNPKEGIVLDGIRLILTMLGGTGW